MYDWIHAPRVHDNDKYHSIRPNSSQNYFEGYVMEEQTLPDGRTKAVRVYKGDWYQEEGSEKQWLSRKAWIGGAFLLALLLFAVASVNHLSGTLARNTSIGIFLGILLGLYQVYGLLNYLPARYRMTIGSYRASRGTLKLSSILNAIFFLALGGYRIYLAFLLDQTSLGKGVGCGICYLLIAGLAAMTYILRRKTTYTIIPGDK